MISNLARSWVLILLMSAALTVAADSEKSLRAEFDVAAAEYLANAKTGNWSQAHAAALKSYQLGNDLFRADADMRIALAHNLGISHRAIYEFDDARRYLKEALKLAEETYGRKDIRLVPILRDYGQSKVMPFVEGSEMRYFRRALAINKNHFGKNSPEHAKLNIEVGLIISQLARTRAGRKFIETGLEILEQRQAQASIDYGIGLYAKGLYELIRRDFDSAVISLNAALSILSQSASDGGYTINVRRTLVELHHKQNKPDLATEHVLAIGRAYAHQGDVQRQLIFSPAMKFPRHLLREGEVGWVELLSDVDESGFTVNTRLTRASGDDAFDKAAIAAAAGYRYAPRFVDGQATYTKDVRQRIQLRILD